MMGAWALAWARTDPARAHAGTVNLQNCMTGGIHPRTGQPFVSYLWLEGGQGALSLVAAATATRWSGIRKWC